MVLRKVMKQANIQQTQFQTRSLHSTISEVQQHCAINHISSRDVKTEWRPRKRKFLLHAKRKYVYAVINCGKLLNNMERSQKHVETFCEEYHVAGRNEHCESCSYFQSQNKKALNVLKHSFTRYGVLHSESSTSKYRRSDKSLYKIHGYS